MELCDLFKDSNTVYTHSLLHIYVDFFDEWEGDGMKNETGQWNKEVYESSF